MGINGTYTSGSYSTYIRNYNSNSGKGRLPTYIAQKEQNEQKAQQLEQNTRQNNQIALSKVQSAQTQIASTINVSHSPVTTTTSSTTRKYSEAKNTNSSAHTTKALNPELENLFFGDNSTSLVDQERTNATAGGHSQVANSPSRAHDDNEDTVSNNGNATPKELTEAELQEIEDLKQRDREVQIHENQHKTTGGAYAQSPSYSYTTGPDGKQYITDGSVSISLSEEKTPAATIKKMEQVYRAALAPAEPSGADRNVASEAVRIANRARQQVLKEQGVNSSEAVDNNKNVAVETDNASTGINASTTPNKNKTESQNYDDSKALDYFNANRVISSLYQSSSYNPTLGSTINTQG